MDISSVLPTVKDWLVPVSTFVTLITGSIGGALAIKDYRLKVQAETRIAKGAELEGDIKLIKLFTEIMNIAHARGGTQVSDKAVEKLLSEDTLKELKLSTEGIKPLLENAVINLPVGIAAQDAAIAAIWVLGIRHELLTPVSIQALTTLTTFKSQVALPYLEDLKKHYQGKLLVS